MIYYLRLMNIERIFKPHLARKYGVPHEQYLVSVRDAYGEWPLRDFDDIVLAREAYTRGLVELATGRSESMFFLYCFPRKKPAAPRKWFTYSGVFV